LTMEKLSINWDEFSSNVVKSFGKLRNEEDFSDVSLVSEDNKIVSAHKIVLSSCSQYFKNLLLHFKREQPILCLEGVSSEDLEPLLDFIYNGQVKVSQNKLDQFLRIARRFKVEGLMQDKNVKEEIINVEYSNHKEANDKPVASMKLYANKDISLKLKAENPDISLTLEDNTFPSTNNEKTDRETNKVVYYSNTELSQGKKGVRYVTITSDEFLSIRQYKDRIEKEIIEDKKLSTFTCKICYKTNKVKAHMKYHIQGHFENTSFSCTDCNRSYRIYNSFRSHTCFRKDSKANAPNREEDNEITVEKEYNVIDEEVIDNNLDLFKEFESMGFQCKSCKKEFTNKEEIETHDCPTQKTKTINLEQLPKRRETVKVTKPFFHLLG